MLSQRFKSRLRAKTGYITLLLCFFVFVIPSYSQTEIQSLTIGTLIYNPPFEIADPNRNVFFGFEIEIMNNVCRRMKVQCIFKPITTFLKLFEQLRASKVDVTVASIIVLKEPQEFYIFSDPYLPSYLQFFTKKDSKIISLSQIKGSKIGTANDPLVKGFIISKFGNTPPLAVYETVQAGIDDLVSGTIDVFLLEAASVSYWVALSGDMLKLVGDKIPIGLGYGVMARKESYVLIEQINQALLAMKADNTYSEIYQSYFGI